MIPADLKLELEQMATTPVLPRLVKHHGRLEHASWWFDDSDQRRWKYFGANLSDREALAMYRDWISQWSQSSRLQNPKATATTYTCTELAADHLLWAQARYVKNGKPIKHVEEIEYAMRTLAAAFGTRAASTIAAPELARLRDAMITGSRQDADGKPVEYARSIRTVNGRLTCIKYAYRWAREQGHVTAEVVLDLLSVRGLTRRDILAKNAKPNEPIRPIDEHFVCLTKDQLPQVVRDMIDLQWFAGMRPGEVCVMRPMDIERGGEIWLYRPVGHKTVHLERDRIVALGKRCQRIIDPYLTRSPAAFCFSPREAMAERLAAKRAARKTPLYPSHMDCGQGDPLAGIGEYYTTETYRRAIHRAIEKADKLAHKNQPEIAADVALVPVWSPNQLRHSWATRIRQEFGIEATAAGLGHAEVSVTELYAERDLKLAMRVARRVG